MRAIVKKLILVLTAFFSACTTIYDFDRPLVLPDGSPTACVTDEDCDDGILCTLVVCRDLECVIPAGGDTRDKDDDTFVDIACDGDDCDDQDENVHPGAEDLCNGVDDDCSGVVDDGAALQCPLGAPDEPCTTSCGSTGVRHCTASCEWECEAPSETCNGIDDDCDGICDEDEACCAGELIECTTICGSTGTQVCTDDCQRPEHCIPPAEVCNGDDDDCDDIVDEPVELRVSNGHYYSQRPSVVWNGVNYGVAWLDSRDTEGTLDKIYFALLDETGHPIAETERNVSSPEWSVGELKLLWTGEEFLVLFQDPPWLTPSVPDGIYLTRLDEAGEPVETNIPLIVDGVGSAGLTAVWTGESIGVAIHDYRDALLNASIYFARFSAEGEPLGEAVRVDDSAEASTWPTVAWTGAGYVVVWEDGRGANNQLYMATLDDAGVETSGEDLRLTDTEYTPSRPTVIWVEELGVLALVWHESWAIILADVMFMLVEADGTPVGESGPLLLSEHGQYAVRPDVVWTGSEFAVAWHRGDDDDQDIYAVRVSSTQEELGREILVSNENSLSQLVDLAWTGSRLGLVWQDDRLDDCETRDVPLPCTNWNEIFFTTDLCWSG